MVLDFKVNEDWESVKIPFFLWRYFWLSLSGNRRSLFQRPHYQFLHEQMAVLSPPSGLHSLVNVALAVGESHEQSDHSFSNHVQLASIVELDVSPMYIAAFHAEASRDSSVNHS